jgi:predicted nucleic acid-binding protein
VGFLIDSSVLVAAERSRLDLDAVQRSAGDEDLAIAAITASELLHGVHRADTPARRHRREAFVESLLSRLPILAFDLLAARIHARIWAELMGKGVGVGAHDLQIAATALSRGLAVATRDSRSFPGIPGLAVVRW